MMDDGRVGDDDNGGGGGNDDGYGGLDEKFKSVASPTLTSLIPQPPLSPPGEEKEHHEVIAGGEGKEGDGTDITTTEELTAKSEEDIVDTVDRKFRFLKSTNVSSMSTKLDSSHSDTLENRDINVRDVQRTLKNESNNDGNNATTVNERIGRKLSFEQKNHQSYFDDTVTMTTTSGANSNPKTNSTATSPHSPKKRIIPTATAATSSAPPSPLPLPSSPTRSISLSAREDNNNSIPKINTSPLSKSRPNELNLSPSRSKSKAEQPQSSRRNPMNYKEIEFEKVINEPVVNIAALRKLGWNGIPPQHRPQAWKILLGYLPTNKTRRTQTLKRKRLEYLDIIKQHYDISDNTRTNAEQETLRQVLVDVPRTAPDVPLFRNDLVRQSLSRLLYIWACRHPASSYVQGINDLATPLVSVFLSEFYDNQRPASSSDDGGANNGSNIHESIHEGSVLDGSVMDDLSLEDLQNVEADVYWCLTNLLNGIQDHYTSDQPGVQRMVMRLEDLVNRMDGELTHHLRSVGVEFIQFAFRWMNCLLLREFKLECVIRLWDTYLSEGDGAGFALGFETFHVYVCAAFLCQFSGLLRNMEFDELFGFMQNVPTSDWSDSEIEVLLSQAFVLSTLFHGSDAHLTSQSR